MHRSAARIAVAWVGLVSLAGSLRAQEGEAPQEPEPPSSAYALDAIPRVVPEMGRLRCETSELVWYRGTTLRLGAPVRIHTAFLPFVERFEQLAREVGQEIYGRPPRTLAHAGAYNCRRIRHAETTLSEHALGNALDVRGFDFGSASREQALPDGVPRQFARSFRVRVEDHWASEDPRYATHVAFFARLRQRLESETDLFTVMLGPSFPGHRNHLHLDRAPSRYVQF